MYTESRTLLIKTNFISPLCK